MFRLIFKGLLSLIGFLLSTPSSEDEKIERGYWNKSNRSSDKHNYPGKDVHRDEYGNYIDENGDIDPYK
ncbi:hypothetical protein [Pseudoalteromonas sp.]|uniref:hypothetical protein n=1 Tax=Pseudoalteromonas sp. TaxID=53249 RepID=UPI0023566AD4|nr:hypothetical protein [Pseudoalteromonas sp.]